MKRPITLILEDRAGIRQLKVVAVVPTSGRGLRWNYDLDDWDANDGPGTKVLCYIKGHHEVHGSNVLGVTTN